MVTIGRLWQCWDGPMTPRGRGELQHTTSPPHALSRSPSGSPRWHQSLSWSSRRERESLTTVPSVHSCRPLSPRGHRTRPTSQTADHPHHPGRFYFFSIKISKVNPHVIPNYNFRADGSFLYSPSDASVSSASCLPQGAQILVRTRQRWLGTGSGCSWLHPSRVPTRLAATASNVLLPALTIYPCKSTHLEMTRYTVCTDFAAYNTVTTLMWK